MVAKIMVVVVALFLVGGAIASFHAATPTSCETCHDAAVDTVVAAESAVLTLPIAHATTIVMPLIHEPLASTFMARTFRPPRG